MLQRWKTWEYFLLQPTEILAKQFYLDGKDWSIDKVMTQTISYHFYTEIQLIITIWLFVQSFLNLGVNTCSSPN